MAEHTEQPAPIPRPGVPSIQRAVRRDLYAREQLGVARYGTPLQPHNGRDALRDAYEEALDLSCYLRQVLAERDGNKATELSMTLAAVTGERDALDDCLNEIRDALGISADTAWRAKAILEAVRRMLGERERARRMLVNRGYDVDTHGMDGGLRAALADQRLDYDLAIDVIAEACPEVLSNVAARAVAERALAQLARTEGVTVVRGPDSEPWQPEPVAEEHVCRECAS